VTRPGMKPIRGLAQELSELTSSFRSPLTGIDAVLRKDPFGLINVFDQVKSDERKFLLVVVDQFEELFRFRKESTDLFRDDEAALYVKLLLKAAQKEDADIYVLITMRSEYLGEASQFYNLAEAISDGLFLLPRMKRVQSEEAIVEPALSVGAEIPPSIVQRLLNETEEREDGLPLLQHGLRRLWDTRQNGSIALPQAFLEAQKDGKKDGKTDKYYVEWCLNDHLDEILRGLNEEQRKIAAKVFKLLGERDRKGRLTRRATEWCDIKAISIDGKAIDEKAIQDVVDAFSDEKEGRTFLFPSKQEREKLKNDDQKDGDKKDEVKLDISHEVLLRKWETYSKWLEEEDKDSARYTQLADAADRWARREGELRQGELLQGIDLHTLVEWKKEFQPTAAWASRYTGKWDKDLKRNLRDYKAAMEFLDESLAEFDKELEAKRLADEREKDRLVAAEKEKWKRWARVLAYPALLVTVFVAYSYWDALRIERRVTGVSDQVVGLLHAAGTAGTDGGSMEVRVPAAVHAAQLASKVGPQLQWELRRQVRLDQWELFSALRKGKMFGPTDAKVRSSCGVSVVSVAGGEFAAVADGHNLQIWRLGGDPKPVSSAIAFEGVDCVKFSTDGKQLLASSYSDPGSTAAAPRQSSIKQFSFDGRSLVPLDIATGIESLTGIKSLVAASFVGSSRKVAVLTSDALTLYPSGEARPFKQPVQAGFFSLDGAYLVVSFRNGDAQLHNVNSTEPPTILSFQGSRGLETPGYRDTLQAAAFSQDDCRIVTGSFQGWVAVQGNSLKNGKCTANAGFIQVAQMTSSVISIAVGPCGSTSEAPNCEGDLVAAGAVSGDAAIFKRQSAIGNPAERKPWLGFLADGYSAFKCIHQSTVTLLSFSKDGQNLITASADQKARVFETATGIETARMPHEALVVFVAETGAGILSASQDARLQLTGFDSHTERTVLRDWLKDACVPRASIVSKGTWIWACAGRLQSRDKTLRTMVKEVASLGMSQDGSALVWLDKQSADQFEIHYARGQGWRESVKPESLRVPADTQSPIVALSSNGMYVAISYCSEEDRCAIKVFQENEGETKLQLAKTLDGVKHRILSLAISSVGLVAAGTADGSLCLASSVTKEINVQSGVPESGSVLGPYAKIITAVAFTGDGNVLAAKGDQSIRLYSTAGDLLFPFKPEESANTTAPARTLVFSKNGNDFAAVSDSFATFFKIAGKKLTKGITLSEPGTIQSLAFLDDDTAITSVATRESNVRITHKLSIDKHEKWICERQPKWATPQTVEDCTQLQRSNNWKADPFWTVVPPDILATTNAAKR